MDRGHIRVSDLDGVTEAVSQWPRVTESLDLVAINLNSNFDTARVFCTVKATERSVLSLS